MTSDPAARSSGVRVVEEVVCYVVHDGHLLVFTHDDEPLTTTGVQVPAGTIERGETVQRAAVRELREETGRTGTAVRILGTQRYDLRPARAEIAVRHVVEMRLDAEDHVDADVAERWRAGEHDPATGAAPIRWTCRWIPLREAHVLAAGLGALLGRLGED